MAELNLSNLREEIEKIDEEILSALSKRMEIVESVIKYKIKNNIEITDKSREDSLKAFWHEHITDKNLTKDEADMLFNAVVEISKKRQEEIKRLFDSIITN